MAYSALSWQINAKCRDVPIGVFFHDEMIPKEEIAKGHDRTEWKSLCNSCPVRIACLDTAIVYNMPGIWGGTTEVEREKDFGPEYREAVKQEMIDEGTYIPLDDFLP